MYNALTVDLEEYFHPTEVAAAVDASSWAGLPSRVEAATRSVLEILGRRDVRATFFVLGWVAERYPRLIREVAAAGHEIGCHGYAHRLVYSLTPEEFEQDTRRAQRAIADACGVMPRLYRAASYSITDVSLWALDVLAHCGFTCDSSIYPIPHDRYGIPGFPRQPLVLPTPAGKIWEVPVATVALRNGRLAPVGGGAYLRLLPYCYTAAGLRRLNGAERQSGCLYFHPWELDPDQPRLARGVVARLRTYGGLRGMKAKIERLLSEFRFAPLGEVFPVPADSAAG